MRRAKNLAGTHTALIGDWMPAEIAKILRGETSEQLEVDDDARLLSRVISFVFLRQRFNESLGSSLTGRAAPTKGELRARRLPLPRVSRSVNRLESSYMAEYIESSRVHAVAATPVSRRERKKGRTRADIYAAAMNLFVRRGFDSVTIEDICDAADVARATFFLHFPAKEALLIEYGQRANDELAAAISAYRGSATATLRMAFKMLAERDVRHPDVVRLVIREVLARPRVLSEHDGSAADLVNLLAGVIRRGQKSGEFRRRTDPTVAALTACSAFFALIYTWVRQDGKIDIEGGVAQTLDIILNGLSEKKFKRGQSLASTRRTNT
jgi:AcrR family transcriptional regulator